jgi:hypothetical protein
MKAVLQLGPEGRYTVRIGSTDIQCDDGEMAIYTLISRGGWDLDEAQYQIQMLENPFSLLR